MSVLFDKMFNYGLRAGDSLSPPVMAVPTIFGTPGNGSTPVEYCATFKTIVGESLQSATVVATNAPATLNGVNFVRLSVVTPPSAATYVRFFKKVSGVWEFMGEETAAVAIWDDKGAATTGVTPPSTDTSGRTNWRALLWRTGKDVQRAEMMDQQAVLLRAIKDLGDTTFKNGDVVTGGAPSLVSTNVYTFAPGVIYFDGQMVPFPAGNLTLDGSGTEKAGLSITPIEITDSDDPILRNFEEGVDIAYCQDGAYRLTYNIEWVLDQPGQVNIQEFIDGQIKNVIVTTERSQLDIQLARERYDTSGHFVVNPFPFKMRDHLTDASKMTLEVHPGIAYPLGFRVQTKGVQTYEVSRAREYGSENNSTIDGYISSGGATIGTGTQNFDLDGLAIKIQIGSGNNHTVTFSGNGKTAATVASEINASVNAYPTSGTLVQCSASGTHVQLKAVDGKSLTVKAVASDAYTILGISTGTYQPTGQRIYPTNNTFIKAVTDFNFICEIVEAVTHDGTSHKDLLTNTNVSTIVGAANALVDAHDGKWDYEYGVDFGRTGNYIDFSLYGGADPTNGQTIYVKYRYRRNAVKGTKVRVRVIDAQITKGAEDGADNIVFTGGTATEVISGNPVAGLSGNASNVISILRVNDSSGQSQTEYTSYSLSKNATALAWDTSTVDWSAAGAPGTTGTGQPTSSATYYVSFEYWKTVVEGDYLTSDSYITDYDEIETAPDLTTLLRDCVDFRPAGQKPIPADSAVMDYDYYLSRYDKVVLDQYGTFTVLKGVAALNPVPPANQDLCLPLAVLKCNPYTYSVDTDVSIVDLGYRRTPQIGIQDLRERIERSEEQRVIDYLQNSADDHAAAVSGTGLFADPLIGQGKGDVAFSKSDADGNLVVFTAAIDQQERCIRLPVSEDAHIITVDDANSTGITRVGKVVMFDYEESPYIIQDRATGIYNVNADSVFSWIGTLRLTPEQDFYTDVERLPDLTIEDPNSNYAALLLEAEEANRSRQITWGSWSLAWDTSGGWAVRTINEAVDQGHWSTTGSDSANALRERTGTTTTTVAERNLVDMGDKVIDQTVLPYMRTKYPDGSPFTIEGLAQGLGPNTEMACTIDEVAVSCTPTGSTVAGSHTYQSCTTVTTDASGQATFSFIVPEGIRVGSKIVKFFYYIDPDESYCMSQFTSQGYRQTVQDTTVAFASLVERTDVVTEQQFHYGDPLAETFAVTEGTQYISSVEIAFATKDPVLPITCEIRTALSDGTPSRQVMQTCTLNAADVEVSATGAVRTKFTFDNIVGYTPGEYAIVLLTNNTQYNVFVAEGGLKDLVTGETLYTQAYDGVLFHSPNNSYWQGETEIDLTFRVNICNFQNDAQVVFNSITGIEANMLALAVTQFLGPGVNLTWSYSLDGSKYLPFQPGLNTELGSVTSQVNLLIDVTALGGTFQLVDQYAGIVLLLNELDATYVSNNTILTDENNYPTQMKMIVDMATDGVNGTGVRTETPYWTPDDGLHWIELEPVSDFVPVDVGDGTYKQWEFVTPDEASITGASNATPVVITSEGQGFKDNQLLIIAGVEGNTAANNSGNAVRVKNSTADTFEIYDAATDIAIAGNDDYTTGGTATPAEFTEFRTRIDLVTTNQAVTPKAGNICAVAF